MERIPLPEWWRAIDIRDNVLKFKTIDSLLSHHCPEISLSLAKDIVSATRLLESLCMQYDCIVSKEKTKARIQAHQQNLEDKEEKREKQRQKEREKRIKGFRGYDKKLVKMTGMTPEEFRDYLYEEFRKIQQKGSL